MFLLTTRSSSPQGENFPTGGDGHAVQEERPAARLTCTGSGGSPGARNAAPYGRTCSCVSGATGRPVEPACGADHVAARGLLDGLGRLGRMDRLGRLGRPGGQGKPGRLGRPGGLGRLGKLGILPSVCQGVRWQQHSDSRTQSRGRAKLSRARRDPALTRRGWKTKTLRRARQRSWR